MLTIYILLSTYDDNILNTLVHYLSDMLKSSVAKVMARGGEAEIQFTAIDVNIEMKAGDTVFKGEEINGISGYGVFLSGTLPVGTA